MKSREPCEHGSQLVDAPFADCYMCLRLENTRLREKERMFPIMVCQSAREHQHDVRAPLCIPWSLVEPGREQAMSNHGQTLERLAERGGLAPGELRCALEGKKLWPHFDDYAAERCGADEAWLAALATARQGETVKCDNCGMDITYSTNLSFHSERNDCIAALKAQLASMTKRAQEIGKLHRDEVNRLIDGLHDLSVAKDDAEAKLATADQRGLAERDARVRELEAALRKIGWPSGLPAAQAYAEKARIAREALDASAPAGEVPEKDRCTGHLVHDEFTLCPVHDK